MLRGLPASIALHAGIVAAGYVAWPYMQKEIVYVQAVPVDIVTVADVTDIAPIIKRETTPTEEPEAPPPEDPQALLDATPDEEIQDEDSQTAPAPAAETEPEEAEIIPDPEPEPEPKKPEPKKPEPKKSEPKKPEPKVVKKEEPKEDDLDLDEFANLFDKAEPTRRTSTPTTTSDKPSNTPPPSADKPRRGQGEQQRAVASVEAMLVSQMKICWASVDDQPNKERLVVTVRVKLNENGTLKEEPELINPRRIPVGDKPMQLAIDRALLATRKCAPYKLPGDYYDIWREIDFIVGPDSAR